MSVVHENTTLQPVQKLHYLKSCLTGEAERLLSHVPVTNQDYEPAWEKLRLRYENKRLLVNIQLKKLANPIQSSNETAKGLRLLLDTTEECLQQLKSLGVTVGHWDTLLIYSLIQGLSVTTIKLWEEELSDSQELPKLKKFTDFLQTRARVLESVSNTIKEKVPSHQKTRAYMTKGDTKMAACPACNGKHYLGTCNNFLKMDAVKRLTCISKSGRCFNCLSSKHSIKQCTNKNTCRHCSRRHHTLLHTSNSENTIEKTKSSVNSNTGNSEASSSDQLSVKEDTQESAKHFLLTSKQIQC